MQTNGTYIGIDLGGTNVKIGCFDPKLQLIAKTSTPTRADMGAEAVVDRIADAVEKLLAENGYRPASIAAAGIGAPGPADLEAGVIIASPNMPLFKNVPLRKMLQDRLKTPVVLENDANAACWGEYVLGAGKDVNNMAFFTLGTGIGGGLVIDGKLIHGHDNNAAELGHVIIYPDGRQCGCGQRGCVEAYASADSTARRATEAVLAGAESALKDVLARNGRITSKDVYQYVTTDDLARKIADETAKALALVCINVLHTTGPARIVFAGGMIAAGDVLLNRIKDFFGQYVWSLKTEQLDIAFATLAEDAGIIGAAALARQLKQQS